MWGNDNDVTVTIFCCLSKSNDVTGKICFASVMVTCYHFFASVTVTKKPLLDAVTMPTYQDYKKIQRRPSFEIRNFRWKNKCGNGSLDGVDIAPFISNNTTNTLQMAPASSVPPAWPVAEI